MLAELAELSSNGVISIRCATVIQKKNVELAVQTAHRRTNECPLDSTCGRLELARDFIHVRSIGRCAHVFGLSARLT
jgi:hypothetical protein